MLEYFIEDFKDGENVERLICFGDAQDCLSLEEVCDLLNTQNNKIEEFKSAIAGYEHTNMAGLIQALYECEQEFQNKKHNLEQEKINLWFNEDWATKLNKAKPSEKDKEKSITNMLKDKILEVKKLEAKLNLLKRQYETALRYSYDILKG